MIFKYRKSTVSKHQKTRFYCKLEQKAKNAPTLYLYIAI